MAGDSIVGGIIEIEHTDDHTASSPTWDLIGKTTDAVEMSPNTETADERQHASMQRDVAATSEAWEISFTADVVTGTAQLEALGAIDTNSYELKGHVDSRETGNNADAIRITVYENEADAQSGTEKWQVATDDYLLLVGSGTVQVEDYSTRDFTIRSRIRPIRLDAGGTLS